MLVRSNEADLSGDVNAQVLRLVIEFVHDQFQRLRPDMARTGLTCFRTGKEPLLASLTKVWKRLPPIAGVGARFYIAVESQADDDFDLSESTLPESLSRAFVAGPSLELAFAAAFITRFGELDKFKDDILEVDLDRCTVPSAQLGGSDPITADTELIPIGDLKKKAEAIHRFNLIRGEDRDPLRLLVAESHDLTAAKLTKSERDLIHTAKTLADAIRELHINSVIRRYREFIRASWDKEFLPDKQADEGDKSPQSAPTGEALATEDPE